MRKNFLIETERLRLRAFKQSDANALFEITQDIKVKEYVPYAYTKTIKEARDNIKCYMEGDFKNDFYIVIEEKYAKGKILGFLIATKGYNGDFFDMSLIIAKQHRKKGYMSEALKAFISFMPTNSTLFFSVREDNIPSLNTVTKIEGIQEYPTIKYSNKVYRVFKIKTTSKRSACNWDWKRERRH